MERAILWLTGYRRLTIRYGRHADDYCAFLTLDERQVPAGGIVEARRRHPAGVAKPADPDWRRHADPSAARTVVTPEAIRRQKSR